MRQKNVKHIQNKQSLETNRKITDDRIRRQKLLNSCYKYYKYV